MYILGIDTTGIKMSVALCDNDVVVDELFGDSSKKHLETLVPCINKLLGRNSIAADSIGLFAVSIGPGSFTGIRIGAAAISAMAQVFNTPVVQVNTLKALCRNVLFHGSVCPIMDARRGEVFAAAYNNGCTVIEPQAIKINNLLDMLPNERIMFVGDGVDVYYKDIIDSGMDCLFADMDKRLQKASSVCLVGYEMYKCGQTVGYNNIDPQYLRLSQAERIKLEGRK
jgi:tRNA threonylcarbamoyladenosine biosynthesis protein TsaB